MTKLISIFMVVVLLFCGWRVFLYIQKMEKEDKKEAVSTAVNGDSLPGMPYKLQDSYNAAKQRGTAATRAWLKTYCSMVADPRRAWIELDFCVSIARENPAEARRVFAEVKERTPQSSPVWPRIKQLENTFH